MCLQYFSLNQTLYMFFTFWKILLSSSQLSPIAAVINIKDWIKMAELLSQEEKVSPEFLHYLLSNYSIRNFKFIILHLWLNLVHCAPTAKWTWVHKYLSGRFFFWKCKDIDHIRNITFYVWYFELFCTAKKYLLADK